MGLNIGAGGATGANYVEAATFRPKYEYSSGNLLSGDNSIYLQNDYNTNSSLISLTSSDRRITFAQPCKVWVTACNDVICNSTSSYMYFTIRKNGGILSYHLMAKNTNWDQWMGHDFINCGANDYITFSADGMSNVTGINVEWGAWSVLCFFD